MKRFALLALLVACGSTADDGAPSPVAKTPGPAPQPDAPPAPAPPPPSFPILPYPSGPYGSSIGDTMADFTVQGYAMSRTERDPRELPFRDIALSEVRSDPACSCVVVVWGAAGVACHPSIQEDETLSQLVAADPSLCVIESIFANGDEPPPSPFQTAAYPTRADLDSYTLGQRESYPVGLATESTFRALDGWTLAAHPLNFAVRPSDMKVLGFFTMGNDL
ncbi:MAG TPA: hypothetical protein VIF62_04000, partial [Labilithrix sp.]